VGLEGPRGHRAGPVFVHESDPENTLDIGLGDSTRSQDARGSPSQIHDGRFHTDVTGASIEDERDLVTEIGGDVLWGRGTDRAKAIGGGCGQRSPELLEHSKRHWVLRHA
jgi:hypothetical protein